MYKKQTNRQLTIYDFDQPLGLTMNPENRWVKKADSIPWSVIEDKYAALFNSDRGNIAKPVRMALGALIIQSEFQYADTEVVNQIRENPYLQYFVGLPSYKDEKPFDASSMVHFRKRLSSEILIEINELILKPIEDGADDSQTDDNDNDDDNDASGSENEGTLILDATCAPSEIKFPQDTELLNECREKLEGIIDVICEANHLPKPRTYRKMARRDYLNIARKKKKSGKQIRKAIGKQLNYIRRDLGYIDAFLEQGYKASRPVGDFVEIV
uniref:transposase n=1 Tax=Jeotgalibaca porci TaxID=1868793 RepID=UPI00359FC94C